MRYSRSTNGTAQRANAGRSLTPAVRLDRTEGFMEPTHLPAAHAPRTPMVIPDRVALRALRAFTLDPETGCHISTYSTGSHGYAQIGWHDDSGRRATTAHRAAWVAVHGPIPEGQTIDHDHTLCNHRPCVNVAHLRLLPNYENARRTDGRDWPVGECTQGHDNEHLRQSPVTGRWRCDLCSHGKTCADCGTTVTRNAERCPPCAARENWRNRRATA